MMTPTKTRCRGRQKTRESRKRGVKRVKKKEHKKVGVGVVIDRRRGEGREGESHEEKASSP